MKALEKKPTRRFDSVGDLANDIECYLEGLPVPTHPPTPVYRCLKFVRKNRIAASILALLFVALVSAVTLSAWALKERADKSVAITQLKAESFKKDKAISEKQQAIQEKGDALQESLLLGASANSKLAKDRIANNQIQKAELALNAVPESLRDIGWHVESQRLDTSDFTLLSSQATFEEAVFSPNGERFIVGCGDERGPILVYDSLTFRQIDRLLCNTKDSSITCLDYSPNGKFIAAGFTMALFAFGTHYQESSYSEVISVKIPVFN